MRKMSEEEIKKLAIGLILEACDATNFPDTIPKLESEDGEVGFEIDVTSRLVRGSIIYSPQPCIEWLIKHLNDQISEEDAFADFKREQYKDIVGQVAVLIMQLMVDELKFAANSLPALASELFETFFLDREFLRKTKSQKRQRINKVLETVNNNRQERILRLAEKYHSTISPPQYLFCHFYDMFLETWQEAKKCYTQNKKYRNTSQIVKAAFPDLPEDLIDQLGDLDLETARASTIALEHAARAVQLPSKVTPGRTIQRYLKDSRDQRNQVSTEDALNAFNKYCDFLRESELAQEQLVSIIHESMKKMPPLE